jgi:hypothetical protein
MVGDPCEHRFHHDQVNDINIYIYLSALFYWQAAHSSSTRGGGADSLVCGGGRMDGCIISYTRENVPSQVPFWNKKTNKAKTCLLTIRKQFAGTCSYIWCLTYIPAFPLRSHLSPIRTKHTVNIANSYSEGKKAEGTCYVLH